jgi:hypothetical protein
MLTKDHPSRLPVRQGEPDPTAVAPAVGGTPTSPGTSRGTRPGARPEMSRGLVVRPLGSVLLALALTTGPR